MKLISLVVAIVAFAIVTVGCGSDGGDGPGLALSNVPWSNGDEVSYEWLDKNGGKIGTSQYAYTEDGDAWVVSFTDKITGLDQSAKVRIDAQTLKPLGEEKSIKAQGTDATVNTTYKDGKLDIQAVLNGENKSAAIDVPANALDNDQLLVTLRALQFADKYEGKATVVNGSNAAKIPVTVRVVGKEKVDVPAGSYDTWKVELDFGQSKQNAWYQTDSPNNLVQYDNGQTRMVMAK